MSGPDPTAEDGGPNTLLEVFPGAFLFGGLAAVAGGFLRVSAAADRLGEEAGSIERVAVAAAWVDHLAEALFASTLAMLLVTSGRRSPRRSVKAAVAAMTVVLMLTHLTGFPGGAGAAGLTLASAGAAVVLAAGLITADRLGFRGRVALVAGLVLGVGPAWWTAATVRADAPGIPVRVVLYDLVAAPDLFETVEARADAPPGPGVLTPAVDQQTDTGDKPALILPPPAAQVMTVPATAGSVRLMAAVGADGSVVQRLPRGLEALRVRYRILVDGEEAWSEVVEHRRMPPGVWDTSVFRWRHVAGPDGPGLAVRAGQSLRFETALLWDSEEERALVEGLAGESLQLGFGGVTLEKEFREPRALATPEAPNVVYVVMDTLRRDRVGLYGYGRPTTPRLDAFAREGLVFEDAYTTSSWTWPSTASLLTGRLPDSHGVKSSKACTLSQRLPTLPEALQARGYSTAAFVGNPIVEPNRYFDQGFETFSVEVPRFRMSDEVMPPALDWLEVHAPVRFFLYLHLVDPHMPLEPLGEHMKRLVVPKPELFKGTVQDTFRQFQKLTLAPGGVNEDGTPRFAKLPPRQLDYISSVYDAAVATGDHYLGLVLDELELLGLSDRTVIAFTSDHGEALFDHKDIAHGQSLHPELIEVPLVLAGPGLPVGVRSEVPVSNRHLAHTLAVIGGALLDAPHAPLMLADPASIEPHAVYSSTTHGQWNFRPGRQAINGVREGAWSLHHAPTGTDFRVPAAEASPEGQLRLYDIRVDPGEQEDVAGQHPKVAEELRRQLLSELERQRRSRGTKVTLGAGSSTLDLLDDIGYTIGKE